MGGDRVVDCSEKLSIRREREGREGEPEHTPDPTMGGGRAKRQHEADGRRQASKGERKGKPCEASPSVPSGLDWLVCWMMSPQIRNRQILGRFDPKRPIVQL